MYRPLTYNQVPELLHFVTGHRMWYLVCPIGTRIQNAGTCDFRYTGTVQIVDHMLDAVIGTVACIRTIAGTSIKSALFSSFYTPLGVVSCEGVRQFYNYIVPYSSTELNKQILDCPAGLCNKTDFETTWIILYGKNPTYTHQFSGFDQAKRPENGFCEDPAPPKRVPISAISQRNSYNKKE